MPYSLKIYHALLPFTGPHTDHAACSTRRVTGRTRVFRCVRHDCGTHAHFAFDIRFVAKKRNAVIKYYLIINHADMRVLNRYTVRNGELTYCTGHWQVCGAWASPRTLSGASMEAHRWSRRWRAAGRGERAGRAGRAAGRVGGGLIGGRAVSAARRPRGRELQRRRRVEPRRGRPRLARRARGRQSVRGRGGPRPPLEGQPLGGDGRRRPGGVGCYG